MVAQSPKVTIDDKGMLYMILAEASQLDDEIFQHQQIVRNLAAHYGVTTLERTVEEFSGGFPCVKVKWYGYLSEEGVRKWLWGDPIV